MTQQEALTLAHTLHNTEMPDHMLARMLSELEGRIAIEIHGDLAWKDTGKLSVPNPYDRVYWVYLLAMLDLYENNGTRFALTYAEFRRAYEAYANHYRNCGG